MASRSWLLGLALLLGLPGPAVALADLDDFRERTTLAQADRRRAAEAAILIAPGTAIRFAESGTATAYDRALYTAQRLRWVARAYNWPAGYKSAALVPTFTPGDHDFARVTYNGDTVLVVTRADVLADEATPASAPDFRSRTAQRRAPRPDAPRLAERWRDALDAAIPKLGRPMPGGWPAIAGRPDARARVPDDMLAKNAALALVDPRAMGVSVTARAGRLHVTGSVPTDRTRKRLLKTLRGIPGCLGIDDGLTVGM